MDTPIKKNHGERHPNNMLFVAVSTLGMESQRNYDVEVLLLRNGYCQSVRMENCEETRTGCVEFKYADGFWKHLETRITPQRPLWVFAHNMPHVFTLLEGWSKWRQGVIGVAYDEVDWQRPESTIRQDKCKPGLIVDNDPPVVFDLWHRKGGRVVFVDTRNYWYEKIQRFDTAIEQCEHIKSKILALWIEHKKEKLGNWTFTAAGLGWNAWRHRFMTQGVFLHGFPEVDKLERKAYYSGWTEHFYEGYINQDVAKVDVNGLYPHCMLAYRLPVRLNMHSSFSRQGSDIVKDDPGSCIATVDIESESERFPCRNKEGQMEMVCGRFRTTLAGPELARAIYTGCVKHIHEWSSYEMKHIFREHVRYFWEKRKYAKEFGDVGTDMLCKIALVGLYGRFAMKTHKWKALSDEAEMPEKWHQLSDKDMAAWLAFVGNIAGERIHVVGSSVDAPKEIRLVGRHWQIKQKSNPHPNSFPAIPAFITACARDEMLHYILTAGFRHTYRIATDSIIVDRTGLSRLSANGYLDEYELGLLKAEDCGTDAEIRGVHTFRIGDKWVHGGISSDFRVLPDGTLVDYIYDGLESLIESGNSSRIRRFSVVRNNFATYNRGDKAINRWLPTKARFDFGETENGYSIQGDENDKAEDTDRRRTGMAACREGKEIR